MREISSKFPFASRYMEVKGSQIHYIDEGEGDPILFLHGNPTSSYLWRNVIPHLTEQGRCIAPDLIGMGKSDKPDINYGFFDTYEYLEEFIEKMNLKNVTLVLHDWGSGLGFHYARTHAENIKGIVFMESVLKTFEWNEVPTDVRISFRLMRTPGIGYLFVNLGNLFVKKMLPDMIKRKLSKEETDYYSSPYKTLKSRTPLRRWPEDVPLGGKPEGVVNVVKMYSEWLQETEIPKLYFYASPGMANQKDTVDWVKSSFKNLETIHVGEGLHFIQEDHPHTIGEGISKWYETLQGPKLSVREFSEAR